MKVGGRTCVTQQWGLHAEDGPEHQEGAASAADAACVDLVARAGAVAEVAASAGGGGWQQADLPPADDVAAWLTGRLPAGGTRATPRSRSTATRSSSSVSCRRASGRASPNAAAQQAAAAGRITRFREDTRNERIRSPQAEHRYGRKVAWGARSATPGSCSPTSPCR